MKQLSIVIYGAGRMGLAIAEGFALSGLPKKKITFIQPGKEAQALVTQRGFCIHNGSRLSDCSLVIIAVKPRSWPEVAQHLQTAIDTSIPLLSVMASVSLDKLCSDTGHSYRIMRARPNILVGNGDGNILLYKQHCSDQETYEEVKVILSRLGLVYECDQGDAVQLSWISSSVPLVILPKLIMHSVAVSGPEQQAAHKLLINAFFSLAKHLGRISPETISDELEAISQSVVSPSGMNAYAMEILVNSGFWRALDDANAAYLQRDISGGKV